MFKLLKTSAISQARLGQLITAHGALTTPFFMPIATKGAVKSLTSEELRGLGAEIILSNTYHLFLQPGPKTIKKAGGLPGLMNWSGAILTDSGGFQVFSLAKIRKILPGGVEFRSHLDGSKHLLTPKKVLAIQKIIGSDIAMILDVCPPSTASKKEVGEAVAITTKWAKLAKKEIKKLKIKKQLCFAIIQGGIYQDLRLKSLKDLLALDFAGYAIGGLAVGESHRAMYGVLDYLTAQMPQDKPRYLMGVGAPENIIEAVKRGVDMFDCVIPTREARHGRLYLADNKRLMANGKIKYQTINIANAKFKNDLTPINNSNLKNYSRAYLHHLFKTQEPLGLRLATLNNLDFYLRLMAEIRQLIKNNKL